jgi:hypothetical protein
MPYEPYPRDLAKSLAVVVAGQINRLIHQRAWGRLTDAEFETAMQSLIEETFANGWFMHINSVREKENPTDVTD